MGPYIWTHTGKRFYLLDPTPESIDIEDIARALSQICRWTGHSSKFYSVAEHCVRCSYECTRFPLRALLHDAAEAYVGDVSRPLKSMLLPEFDNIEVRVERAIYKKFGLGPFQVEEYSEIKRVDDLLAATEARDLMRQRWPLVEPLKDEIVSTMTPLYAEIRYLERFKELTHEYHTDVSGV